MYEVNVSQSPTTNLYHWFGLPDLPEGAHRSLESVIADGGDWRSKVRRTLIDAVEQADRRPLVYRMLGGDALIVDGRVRQWELASNPPDQDISTIFALVHRELADEIGKPWWPELSPTADVPLAELLETLGFTRIDDDEPVSCVLNHGTTANGPWTRHLSVLERRWLEQRLLAENATHLTSVLKCTIRNSTWTWPVSQIASEHISLSVLTSAARGSGGHLDRWATNLPMIDASGSDSDRTVRLTFRSMASRLAQSGRFIPRRHLYFVANLWEPSDASKVDGEPEEANESGGSESDGAGQGDGTFAPATEFVFTSTAHGRRQLATHDPLPDAMRTLSYLALLQGSNMTLHDIAQGLFSQRRPVLRVAPCSASLGWTMASLEPRVDYEGRSVPAIVKIGVPRCNTYAALRDELITSLRATAAKNELVEAFSQTIWPVVPGELYAFPWDRRGFDDTVPAQFGIHAQSLITAIGRESVMSADVWSRVFAETEDDFEAFSLVLAGWFNDLHLPAADASRRPVEDKAWRKKVYRMLLANSLHFDSDSMEHRQIPIAIGSYGIPPKFLPAGIYLVTYGSERAQTADESFADALSQVNSLQINNHASRAILSVAATRTLRRQMLVEEEVATHQEKLESEAEKIRDAIARERKASDVARQISEATRLIQQKLLEVVSVPARLWELWFGDVDVAHLSIVCHPIGNDVKYLDECRQAIAKANEWLGNLATEGQSFVDMIQSVATASVEERPRRIAALKTYARVWSPDDEGHPTLPEVVRRQVGEDMIMLAPKVERLKHYYPSVPAIWVRAFRVLINDVGGKRVTVTPFVYDTGNGVQTVAGFVSINELAEGDTGWTQKAMTRYTNVLEAYAEPYVGIWDHGNLKWHDDADPNLPFGLDDIVGRGVKAIVVFKGVALKNSKGRIG